MNSTKLEELDELLTDHFLTLLKDGKKPIGATTLAVIAAHLKSRDQGKRPRRTLDTTTKPSEQPMGKLPFPSSGEHPGIPASSPSSFELPLKLPFPSEE
jgi:hypothetical protein